MNIIQINHYAGSNEHGMEYAPYYLAQEWVRLGHNVTMVAASYSHLRNQNPSFSGNILKEEIDGINYIWLKTPKYQGNGFNRILNMFIFSFQISLHKKKLINVSHPDLVIASSPHPFMILGAHKIAKKSGARLIFVVRDLWPLTLIELGGISSKHPFILLMQWVENYAYRISDRVVSLLPKADNYMREHGMSPDKFNYIPNGINLKDWQMNIALPEPYQGLIKSQKQDGKFLIGFTGTHGIGDTLDKLIEAALSLKTYPVTFVLVGEGSEKKKLQQKVMENNLSNVIFFPPVPKLTIPALLELMDVLYIGWKKEPLYRFGISPNKLMDYMMAAKPVIHAIEAGNDIVAESGCGISIPPENSEAIAKAIITLMEMNPSQRHEIGLKGREYILKHHDYSILAKKYLEGL